MSQEQIKTTVCNRTHDAVENFRRANGMEYKSDAARKVLERGLSDLGYLSGGAAITPARRLAREVAKLLFFVSATLLMLSLGFQAEYLAPGVGVFAGSLLVFATDRYVLRSIEPAVTNRLPRIEVNRRGSP